MKANTLEQINELLVGMYKDSIDGGDFTEICRTTGLSRFTVWQYFKGDGKSRSTGSKILDAALDITEARQKSLERAEIMSEDLNNE